MIWFIHLHSYYMGYVYADKRIIFILMLKSLDHLTGSSRHAETTSSSEEKPDLRASSTYNFLSSFNDILTHLNYV